MSTRVVVGAFISVRWPNGRRYEGVVTDEAEGEIEITYDDGEVKVHSLKEPEYKYEVIDLRTRLEGRKRPSFLDDALRRRWAGFPIESERGALELYAKAGMEGVGVRVSCQSQYGLPLPEAAPTQERMLLWFETDEDMDIVEGEHALRRAHEMMRGKKRGFAPEPVQVSEERVIIPARRAAQLVECAVLDSRPANCELVVLERQGKGLWPGLAQTCALIAGEELRWVYNPDPKNPMAACMRRWRNKAMAVALRASIAAAAIEKRKEKLGRCKNGTFKKLPSSTRCVRPRQDCISHG